MCCQTLRRSDRRPSSGTDRFFGGTCLAALGGHRFVGDTFAEVVLAARSLGLPIAFRPLSACRRTSLLRHWMASRRFRQAYASLEPPLTSILPQAPAPLAAMEPRQMLRRAYARSGQRMEAELPQGPLARPQRVLLGVLWTCALQLRVFPDGGGERSSRLCRCGAAATMWIWGARRGGAARRAAQQPAPRRSRRRLRGMQNTCVWITSETWNGAGSFSFSWMMQISGGGGGKAVTTWVAVVARWQQRRRGTFFSTTIGW